MGARDDQRSRHLWDKGLVPSLALQTARLCPSSCPRDPTTPPHTFAVVLLLVMLVVKLDLGS